MPTTDLLVAAPTAPLVTTEDLDLVKRTIATGATDAELKLFLFDCKRRGVHPLDKLIHFTVRKDKNGVRKYTPVTSIDFMRGQAAMTGEMAGSDDATFEQTGEGPPRAAHVTVHRLTQGHRYAYTATARWQEYCPPAGQDHMWRKMPHTMLAKCAEALALRKAFPQQLAGLFADEELAQAEDAPAPTAPKAPRRGDPPPEPEPAEDARDHPEDPIAIDPRRVAQLPAGCVFITSFSQTPTRNKNVVRYHLTVKGGPTWPKDQEIVTTFSSRLADAAETAWQTQTPVAITTKETKFGYDLVTLEPAPQERPLSSAHDRGGHAADPPLTADDIPF